MRKIFISILLLIATQASGQEPHSKASIVMDGNSFSNGMRIGVHVDLEKGWHTYWVNPGDVGAPAVMDMTSTQSIEQSNLIYPIPRRIHADPFDYYGYEDEVLFYKIVSLATDAKETNVDLKIRLDWLVCQDLCVPATKTFTLKLPVTSQNPKRDSHFASFSYPHDAAIISNLNYQTDKTILKLSSLSFSSLTPPDFFPTVDMNQIFNKPISKENHGNEITFTYPQTKSHNTEVHGLVKVDEKTAYWVGKKNPSILAVQPEDVQRPSLSIFSILFFALIGGFILNFMPCVLPVVSLKILSVLRTSSQDRKQNQKKNLVYTLGICVSLLLLAGLFLVFRATGQQLGWGFQLQSPGFVTFLICLFFLIGLNLIGFYEIQGFSFSRSNKLFQPDSIVSEFLNGFLITIVATPCTAPFMAAAIGVALTQPSFIIFLTFLFLGIGLSIPYLVLAFFPKVAAVLPRPGAWMIKFKEFLSFPMFVTVAWLIWVLNRLTETKAILFVLCALIAMVFFFWAKQKIFSQGSLLKKFFLLIVAIIVLLLFLFPLQLEKSEPIAWKNFDPSQVSNYGKDRATFVDFTADWCITCKANERFAFSNSNVLQAIKKNNIEMIKADWTRRDPAITAILRSYDRAGVPFYLLYKPGESRPEILPTLLTPGVLIDAFTKGGTRDR